MTTQQAYQTITASQHSRMINCLGLRTKTKPSRNYFYTFSTHPEWNDLVEKGLATVSPAEREGQAYFALTHEAVELVYGQSLSEDDFNEL